MSGGVKVIVTVAGAGGAEVDSVLQCCEEKIIDGVKYWHGMDCSMYGSYRVTVKQKDCEIWNEQQHDPVNWLFKQRLIEEIARNKPGCLPERYVRFQIREMKALVEKDTRSHMTRNEIIDQEHVDWLVALETYYAEHYGEYVGIEPK